MRGHAKVAPPPDTSDRDLEVELWRHALMECRAIRSSAPPRRRRCTTRRCATGRCTTRSRGGAGGAGGAPRPRRRHDRAAALGLAGADAATPRRWSRPCSTPRPAPRWQSCGGSVDRVVGINLVSEISAPLPSCPTKAPGLRRRRRRGARGSGSAAALRPCRGSSRRAAARGDRRRPSASFAPRHRARALAWHAAIAVRRRDTARTVAAASAAGARVGRRRETRFELAQSKLGGGGTRLRSVHLSREAAHRVLGPEQRRRRVILPHSTAARNDGASAARRTAASRDGR